MLFITSITGTKYRGAAAVTLVGALPRGIRVKLQRQPSNEFDSNAIAVLLGDVSLGFVPRSDNTELAAALDRIGSDVYAEVIHEAVIDKGDIRFAPKIAVQLG